MLRTLSRLLVGLVVVISLAVPLSPGAVLAQIDPQVRDRVVPAVVEIAILVRRDREREHRVDSICPWAAARSSRRTG